MIPRVVVFKLKKHPKLNINQVNHQLEQVKVINHLWLVGKFVLIIKLIMKINHQLQLIK